MPSSLSHGRARQGGFSLFLAMIFLIVLSLLAVATIRGTITGMRMASNTQDWNLAFQSAEAALRDAEAAVIKSGDLMKDISKFPANACTDGLCQPRTDGVSVWAYQAANDAAWQGTATTGTSSAAYGAVTGADELPGPLRQPRYVIEFLGSTGLMTEGYESNPSYAYRVTAVGFGRIQNDAGAPATKVVLQGMLVY